MKEKTLGANIRAESESKYRFKLAAVTEHCGNAEDVTLRIPP